MPDRYIHETPQDRHRRVNDRLDDIEKKLALGETRFSQLRAQVADVQTEVRVNTDVTLEVRDIIITFKTFTKVMKWSTALGAFGLMLWHMYLKAVGRAP